MIVHTLFVPQPLAADTVSKMHDHAFSKAVRARRRELRLRQDQLAELAQCSTRFVHMVESGKTTVRFDKLLALLDALGLGFELRCGAGLHVTTDLGTEAS